MPLVSEIISPSRLVNLYENFGTEVEVVAKSLGPAFRSTKPETANHFLEDCLTTSTINLAVARLFSSQPTGFAIPGDGFEVHPGDLMLAVLQTDTFGMCLQTEYPVADINGDGQVGVLDYTIMKLNWFQAGDAE